MTLISRTLAFATAGLLAMFAAPLALLLWTVGSGGELALPHDEWELCRTARNQVAELG